MIGTKLTTNKSFSFMKKKIEKIIFCTPEYITEKNYGGLSIYIKKIKNLLNKKGIKTYIMVSSDRNQTIKDGKNIIFKIILIY